MNKQLDYSISTRGRELTVRKDPPSLVTVAFPNKLSVANLATLSLDLASFQTPLATFFKAPSDKSSDFWKNLSNLPNVASTVL